MITLARKTLLASVAAQRFDTIRSISSVVPDLNLNEFELYNEPLLSYKKGSKERKQIEDSLAKAASNIEDIPIVIGNQEYRTNHVRYQVMPHNHSHKLAKFYYADSNLIQKAIKTAYETQKKWDETSLSERLRIWLRAADLMAKEYRQELNAATMLGQSKTVIQAEIDAAAELIDFIRMNAYFLKENSKYQPISENLQVTKNSQRFRGIDGFIAAVSPFNFTAIGGNLSYTPALMGNGVVWKPSDTAILSNWTIFKIMREAGVPAGVVNFVPADGPVFGDTITASPDLAGINFTGSVPTFNRLWRQIGDNIDKYRNFPRLVGECGGKNYHFVHPTADKETVINATIRSAFEYCGQKCSACSRMYVPESLWPAIKAGLIEKAKSLKIGDVQDFTVFTSAVIDDKAFARITSYIEHAKNSSDCKIIVGGTYSDKVGYFVNPTIVETSDPLNKLMREEIFGPVLTVYAYPDKDIKKAMDLVNNSTKFALTGAVFAEDDHLLQNGGSKVVHLIFGSVEELFKSLVLRKFLFEALREFKMSAGNFYINDKSTGSVVGQQPFGGGRMSGTNDKAGGPHYILKWTSMQAIKETFVPLREITYPYMD